MFVLYVGDGIFMSPDKALIDKAIKDLIAAGLKIETRYTNLITFDVNIKKMMMGSLNDDDQH